MTDEREGELIAHLIGSIPADDPEDAFRLVAERLGDRVERIPDGETGRRVRWIGFVAQILREHPDLEVDPEVPVYQFKQWDGAVVFEIEQLRFRAGVDPSRVTLHTGYADDAIRSFEIFDRLQGEGVIPPGIKYQICSASPLAISYMYITPACRKAFTEVYMAHLIDEVRRIAAALPHDRISYQWDVCQEVLMWEGYFDQHPGYKEEILETLGRVGDAVPPTIDLGYHLCYGSPRDEHLVQPEDMAVMVEMANGIFAAVRRPIRYIHMPVPHDRTDEPYFSPLRGLSLPDGTGLYLGLVHDGDDDGNAAKLALARRFAPVAGVAAECGLGRSPRERIGHALDAHRTLIERAVA